MLVELFSFPNVHNQISIDLSSDLPPALLPGSNSAYGCNAEHFNGNTPRKHSFETMKFVGRIRLKRAILGRILSKLFSSRFLLNQIFWPFETMILGEGNLNLRRKMQD